jgi:hypothetical protein
MHPWAETFKSAARGLSDRERATLSTPAAAKPAFVRVKNDVSGIVSSDREGMMQIFGEMPDLCRAARHSGERDAPLHGLPRDGAPRRRGRHNAATGVSAKRRRDRETRRATIRCATC